ncbi:hypothetical protein M8J76_016444 [Diaphorina citri]|nr:hypothetical protein M8J76_016444 [Diaphorina citri]
MFSICKETHPATGVEHAVSCHFYNRAEKCLVVAGANIIRVFQLVPDIDPVSKTKLQDIARSPPKMKLECVSQFSLAGNVMSMQSVTLNNSERDALLLSFKEAKVSIVQYDMDTHDLKTLSLHYFEEEEMKMGWSNHWQIPIIRVDPQNRCAVLLAYGRQIVVLPFRKGSLIEDPNNKEQVLASYTIPVRNIEAKLDNIIDLQFLHGYYEPTLLILYESIRTFPGRIAVRKDTCSMVSVSLNIQQRVYPVIWSVSNLPFDCIQALPVRKPLGGTLILTNNALIYLNQSIPPYGVSLNSIADASTSFPLEPQEGISICLEGAQCAFIDTDKVVISLKGGELYVLTLQTDSVRSVNRFHFEKSAASVLTTCVCVCGDNYLFLGSRLGNSLLLRFSVKEKTLAPPTPIAPTDTITLDGEDDRGDQNEDQEPASKKKKLGDWMASNVADINDDELEVYGNQQATNVEITSYAFEVCDSLLNIGPCGNITMGEPAFLSEEFVNTAEPDIELVTTSGHGKNGALCILQRSIRPQIVTTFELPGCTNMWTVVGGASAGNKSEADTHAFLILSQDDSTMVLQTGREINELDSSGFTTHCPSVFAGNIGSNKYIVQVTAMAVHLLQEAELVQTVTLEVESVVVTATLADPYLVLLTQSGELVMLVYKETKQGQGRLTVRPPPSLFPSKPQITNISLHRDTSSLFSLSLSDTERTLLGERDGEKGGGEGEEYIDEDELLYGDGGGMGGMLGGLGGALPPQEVPGTPSVPFWLRQLQERRPPSYWLILTRIDGNLEIYSLLEFKLVFLAPNIGHGPKVLYDHSDQVLEENSDPTNTPDETIVQELLTVSLGLHGNRPLLLVRTQHELLIYQAFRHPKGTLKLRFKKLKVLFVSDRSKRANEQPGLPRGVRISQMRYFSNIAGYQGVFLCGPHPAWLFLTSRGELRAHPMTIDGPVSTLAPFHNVNCPRGFLYFNAKSELRISVLPTHLSYDAPWPVPLKCTPHFLAYHLETKTYCIVTSTAEPSTDYYKFNGEDKELVTDPRDSRFIPPLVSQFHVSLFSPFSWEEIPQTNFPLHEWEHVLCLKNVSMEYEGTLSGLRGYIALGTNYNYSEDVTCRGRILLFDIIEVVPEPGQPLTKNKIKMIYAKEQKGPVTAICHVAGFLVTAVGQKIYIWQLKDNDLTGIAFIDTEVYIASMVSVKNLILVGDYARSIALLRYQPEYRTLSLVARDYKPTQVYACEFVIESSSMGFMISDKDKNVVLFMYQPEARESNGGHRLIKKTDFHLGQHVNTFFKIRCKPSPISDAPGARSRFLTWYASLDGALGFFLPLPEKNYRRLLMLQNVMVTHTSHTGGLNPRAFRTYKGKGYYAGNPSRGIIDGSLVWKFLQLSLGERLEICKKIGSKHNDILDELYDIEALSSHF